MTDILIAKLDDAIKISDKRPHFIGFLDEAEVYRTESYLKNKKDIKYMFWGGHEGAERQMIGFFPDYIEPTTSAFPIEAVTIKYRTGEELNHRNFLGTFMGIGIIRPSIGDILIEDGRCVAFTKKEMHALFLQDISKIGKTGVKVTDGADLPLPLLHKFEEISGVVASLRLDCVTAFLMRSGREKATAAIKQGYVSVNHTEVSSVSHKLRYGDIISIRKKGRFILDENSSLTSKGRLIINLRKYI